MNYYKNGHGEVRAIENFNPKAFKGWALATEAEFNAFVKEKQEIEDRNKKRSEQINEFLKTYKVKVGFKPK